MADKGVEIGLGAINDPNFGPYVMVAAGGVLIELLADRAVALAPIGRDTARTLIARLKVAKLLGGVRGGAKLDIDALADCLARLSVLAWDNRERIAEIDINPVIVTPRGCMAVDALVVPHRPKNESR
jgi:acyl-CoA synthetase (NDP forming)